MYLCVALHKFIFVILFIKGGQILVITGKGFGTQWLTSTTPRVGGVIVGKKRHEDKIIELVMPPLPHGEHIIELPIDSVGYAVYA